MNTEERARDFRIGISFAVATTILWGLQPFFMKIALIELSAFTISWFRLTLAGALLAVFFALQSPAKLKEAVSLPPRVFLSGVLLGLNYYFFLKSIEVGGPTTSVVLMQSGPLLLILIGVIFFQERFTLGQTIALILSVLGFCGFSAERLLNASRGAAQGKAVLLVLLAVLTWVGFSLIQKRFGRRYAPASINLAAFFIASLTLLATVNWQELAAPFSYSYAAMIYLSFSTLAAYGCLVEAIELLPLSTVSIIIVLNPFVTIGALALFHLFGITFFEPQPLSLLGLFAGAVAISGAARALYRKNPKIS